MNKYFKSKEALQIYDELRKPALNVIVCVNNLNFSSARNAHKDFSDIHLKRRKELKSAGEQILNDLYVINQFVELLSIYSELWELIIMGKFSDSWGKLQDALDTLRCIKKFSDLKLPYFEEQLIELEKAYPYNVFFSIGATVEMFECSICGFDIDLPDCIHRIGELYSGELAVGIARNLSAFDHIAMVSFPEDKRCVVTYDDNGEQFKVVRYLSTLISSNKLLISDFKGLSFISVRRKNPDFIKQKRNELCSCGSKRKFKKCCMGAEYIDGEHVDVVGEKYCVEHVIS